MGGRVPVGRWDAATGCSGAIDRALGVGPTMQTVGDLGEFGVIARLTQGLPPRPDVILGVGDDAAILEVVGADAVLVATCDAQVEGTHFRLDRATPEEIGQRALTVNVSDIAAMGALPRFALVSLLLPPNLDVAILEGIYTGLRAAGAAYGVALVGGNVARNPERLILDITLLGTAQRGHILRRDGARAGDAILVTGTVGAAAAGLRLLEDPVLAARIAPHLRAILEAAQRTPSARVAAGQWLARNGATAALDISDGLAADLAHLCAASGVGAVLNEASLPIVQSTRVIAETIGCAASDLALFGGEDYELLFTTPPARAAEIAAELFVATGTFATVIGTTQAAPGMLLATAHGTVPLPSRGWDHLRASDGTFSGDTNNV
jgi:thiamine-monophosphate kinase